jgi:hypothetical protein
MNEEVYYYKDRPYRILYHSQMKIEGVWIPCIVYKCLYENHDGDIWVRSEKQFFELFHKTKY